MHQYVEQAHGMLEIFVENFPIVFGANSVSFNVHSLLHISACAQKYGTLMSFSAYEFENKLQILKSHVRKPSAILLVSRNVGLKYKRNKVIGAYVNDCLISAEEQNNFCSVGLDIIVKIEEIIVEDRICFEGRRLLFLESFFQEPTNSCSLGIYKTNLVHGEKKKFFIEEIQYKLLCLPFESNFVLIPVLHSCQPGNVE